MTKAQAADKVTLECITRTPRSINPYTVRWFKDGVEIMPAQAPHLTMYNYFKDDQLDGSVLNFNKLVIAGPITHVDQGEYMVCIGDNLKSSGVLVIADGDEDEVSEGLVFKETVTYQLRGSEAVTGLLTPINETDTKMFNKATMKTSLGSSKFVTEYSSKCPIFKDLSETFYFSRYNCPKQKLKFFLTKKARPP